MKLRFALAAVLVLGLGGCTTLGATLGDLGQSLSTSTPSQVNTYGDATAAAALATRTVDLSVSTGKLDLPTLQELQTLNDGIHAAWLKIKAAKDAGQSLSFAAFNAALAAYQSYRTNEGIPEAPAAPTS